MKTTHAKVERRGDEFTQRPVTRIWSEQPTDDNPYIAENCACHGYDLMELMEKRSFVDMFFLLFKGELPKSDQAQLLEKLMIALINPGPRHPAGRAAMCAGVGKTNTAHILPIALSTLSGEHLGAGETKASMRFLEDQLDKKPDQAVEMLIAQNPTEIGDCHIAPGFGSRFGSVDRMSQKIATYLATLPGAGKALKWGNRFAQALTLHNMGWLTPGIAAAVFVDLELHPRSGPGLFQLLHAPGLFAHGFEFANKPLTAMPFIKDEDYTIES